MRITRIPHIEWIYKSTFGKTSLISTQQLWPKHCFASSQDKMSFVYEKVFWSITQRWEKKFDWLEVFLGLKDEYLWLASSYNLGLILGTTSGPFTQVIFFFQFYWEKTFEYLQFFWKEDEHLWLTSSYNLGLIFGITTGYSIQGNLFLQIHLERFKRKC